jgi:hypothetical protein
VPALSTDERKRPGFRKLPIREADFGMSELPTAEAHA